MNAMQDSHDDAWIPSRLDSRANACRLSPTVVAART